VKEDIYDVLMEVVLLLVWAGTVAAVVVGKVGTW